MAEKKPASSTLSDEDSSSDTEETFPDETIPVELTKQVNSPRPRQRDNDDDDSPEANFRKISQILESEEFKKLEEEEELRDVDNIEELYDFPRDPENWKEEDLREYWADGPPLVMKTGWDPNWVDKEDVDAINDDIRSGKDPAIAPFYVPYRKCYPAIPDNHYDKHTRRDQGNLMEKKWLLSI